MFSEIKKLVKQSGIYAFGNLSGHFLSFMLLPVYTRYLSTEQYGILALITVFRTIMHKVVNLGMESSVVKVFFEEEEEYRRKEVISTAFFFMLVTATASTGLLWAFRRVFAEFLLNSPHLSMLFSFAVIASCFFLINAIPLSVFRAQERATVYTIFSVFTLLSGLLFNILFVIVFQQGVEGILKSAVLSQGITFLLILLVFTRDLVPIFRIEYLKRMLSFGVPIVPSGLAIWILTLLDRYFLKVFANMELVGIYSLGYRIAMIMQMLVVIPFSLAWGPFALKWQGKEGAESLYAKIFKYYAIAGFFFVLVLSLYSRELIQMMTTPAYYDSYKIVFLISLSYLFHGFYMIFTLGCTFFRKTYFFAIATGSAAVVNTVLNIILIPRYQMMGAAAATAISYFMMTLLMYFFSEKFYHVPFNFFDVLKIGIVCAILYIGGIFIDGGIFFTVAVKLPLLLSYFLFLYILRVITPKEVSVLRKKMRSRI